MFPQQSLETKRCEKSENETVDGQNIQTLQHALCWTPAPPNLNVSARVLAKVVLGVWFFSSIGANALQVTITLNFGGEGVVPDRRGLNISSIYSIS